MRVRFSRDAVRDLNDIHDYISRDSRAAADRVAVRLRAAADRLADHPFSGRSGTFPETREWLVAPLPYLIVYRVDERPPRVLVVRVFHTSRDRSREAH